MSSNYPGNSKNDRSKHSRTPYDRPSRSTDTFVSEAPDLNNSKSIIHQVKDSVSELLSNSWLSGWINSKNSKKGNKSVVKSNPTPSTSQQQGRYNDESDSSQDRHAQFQQNYPEEGESDPIPSTSKDVLPSPSFISPNRYPKSRQTAKTSHAFTSSTPATGLSRVQGDRNTPFPQLGMEFNEETPLDKIDEVSRILNPSDPEDITKHETPSSMAQMRLSRKRLRGDESNARDSTNLNQSLPQEGAMANKRPRFNLSSYGSPIQSSITSMTDSSQSIFYPGKTMFGGAGNYRKMKTTPNRILHRHQIKAQPATPEVKVTEDGGLSLAAKKILDCLDKMTTPLSEAKRIPATRRRSEYFESPTYIADFHKHRPSLRTPGSAKSGPPVTKLLTPTQAVIKQNLNSYMEKQSMNMSTATAKAVEEESSLPEPCVSAPALSVSEAHTPKSTSMAVSTKKPMSLAQVSSSSYFANASSAIITKPFVQDESIKMTGIAMKSASSSLKARIKKGVSNLDETPLEIPDLPQVSLPLSSLPTITFNALPTFTPQADLTKKKEDTFSFSTPEVIGESAADCSEGDPSQDYTFSQPSTESGEPTSEVKTAKIAAPLDPSPLTVWANKFLPPKNSWECTQCCVMNKEDAKKCVACTAMNPKLDNPQIISLADPSSSKTQAWTGTTPSLAPSISSKVIGNFGNLFKKPPGQWECDTCMVNNKPTDNKCISCQTERPGSTSKTSTPLPVVFELKETSKGWECNVCTDKNKQDTTVCSSCDAPKDYTFRPQVSQLVTTSSYKFGVSEQTPVKSSSSSGFSFGENSTVKTPSPTYSFRLIHKEDKPSTAPTSDFSFGIKAAQDKTATAPSSAFSFGVKATAEKPSTPISSGFSFGAKPAAEKSVTSSLSCGTKRAAENSSTSSSGFNFETKAAAEKPTTAPSSIGLSFDTKPAAEKSSTSSSGPISFGIKPAADKPLTTSLSGPISFGAKPASINPSSSSSSGFSFGAAATAEKSATTPSPSGFSFGTKPATDKPPTAPASDGFRLGANHVKETPQVIPSFGSKPAENKPSTPLSLAAKLSESTPSTTASSGFSFGAKLDAPKSVVTPKPDNGFSFGSKSTEAPTAKSTNLFGFASQSVKSPETTPWFSMAAKSNGLESTKGSLNNNTVQPSANDKPSLFAFGAADKPKPASAFGAFQSNGVKESASTNAFSSMSPATTTTPIPSAGVFSFGSVKPAGGDMFKFGEKSEKPLNSTGFGFGQSATPAAPSLFASKADTSIFGKPAASPAQPPAFGASESSTPASNVFSAAASSNMFGFGDKKSDPPPYQPSPTPSGFPSAGNTTVPSMFAFGQVAEKPSGGLFAFGQSEVKSNNAGFNFSGSENAPQVNFSFGTAQPTAAPQQGGGVFQFQKPSFNPDTAVRKQSPAPTNSFSLQTANPFNSLPGNTDNPQGRVIRKAMRRNRK